MKLKYLQEFLFFLLLILVQVLLLNRISIFGVTTPILYIYFLLKLPIGRSPYFVIISAFLMGFLIDIFLNTPGMNAAAVTIAATVRKPILNLFYEKELHQEYVPSLSSAAGPFVRFSTFMVLFHITLLFLIESFALFNLLNTVVRIAASSLISILLILSIEGLTYMNKHGASS